MSDRPSDVWPDELINPARCPSCGSDDPRVVRGVCLEMVEDEELPDSWHQIDAWHVSPKEEEK